MAQKIGRGSTSFVYKKDDVAVKVFNTKVPHDYETEARILEECKPCPYIVQYLSHDFEGEEKSISMELMDVNLLHLIENRKVYPLKDWVGTMLNHLLIALDFLEDHEIYHGDLTTSNVMVKLEKNKVFKLIDFSHSDYNSSGRVSLCNEIAGAPELYNLDRGWDRARMMIWSLGQLYYFCNKRTFLLSNLYKESTFYERGLEIFSFDYFKRMRSFIGSEEFNQADIEDFIEDLLIYPEEEKFKKFLHNCCRIEPQERKTAAQHLKELF